MKSRFSFEISESTYQKRIAILSPIHKSYIPRIGAPIIVLGFLLFFLIELVNFFQNNFEFDISLSILGFGVVLCTIISIVLLSRFTIEVENEKVYVGRRFWKFFLKTTLSKYEITDIRWVIKGKRHDYYIYLVVETSYRTHQFQPLGIEINSLKPRPELQQFLDSFLQELNQLLMR